MTKYRPAPYIPWSRVIILTVVLGLSDLFLFFRHYRPTKIRLESVGMSYDYDFLIYLNVFYFAIIFLSVILRFIIHRHRIGVQIEIKGNTLICKKNKTTRFDIHKFTEFGTIAHGKSRYEEFYFIINDEMIRLLTPDALLINGDVIKALKGANKEYIFKKNSIYSFKAPIKTNQIKVINKK